MIVIDISTEEKFLENRTLLVNVFKTAILETVEKMGDDIKGVPWFNPRWKAYLKAKYKKAA